MRLAAQTGQLLEQLGLRRVERGRRLDDHRDDEVAASATQSGDAVRTDRLVRARLRARLDLELERRDQVRGRRVGGEVGLERRQGERRAERGGGHRDRDGAVQVVALPVEDRVAGDLDLDVQIAGGAATRADLALPGELDAGAVVDAGRDLDGEGTAGPDPAV